MAMPVRFGARLVSCILLSLSWTSCQTAPLHTRSVIVETPAFPALAPTPARTTPHGGILLELGRQHAWLEIVHDHSVDRITLYVLDAQAKQRVPIRQRAVLRQRNEPRLVLPLTGVRTTYIGETAEYTSLFSGHSFTLRGVERFAGELKQIRVRGRQFQHVALRYPEN
jgi:hypothetical protein